MVECDTVRDGNTPNRPFLSVIVPVFNGYGYLTRCISALRQSTFSDWELIIVDDGSTDGTFELVGSFKCSAISTDGRLGPGAARNLGAKAAEGEYLVFIDCDCEVHPETLGLIACAFKDDPDLDALFGSYDDAPSAQNFISQYKNLFQHYVHQDSTVNVSTFWAGCGAIKPSTFFALHGFDLNHYTRPAIEDIDLGYRLAEAGGKIQLFKQIQVTHAKEWTFLGLLKSDIINRAIPWTQLILRYSEFKSQLNISARDRMSVVMIYALLLSLCVGILLMFFAGVAETTGNAAIWLSLLGLVLAVLLMWTNRGLYRFFYSSRGLWFTIRAIPMHWLYFIYCAPAFGFGLLIHLLERLKLKNAPIPTSLTHKTGPTPESQEQKPGQL